MSSHLRSPLCSSVLFKNYSCEAKNVSKNADGLPQFRPELHSIVKQRQRRLTENHLYNLISELWKQVRYRLSCIFSRNDRTYAKSNFIYKAIGVTFNTNNTVRVSSCRLQNDSTRNYADLATNKGSLFVIYKIFCAYFNGYHSIHSV